MKDPYSLLGVARDADLEVIKQAYRKLAKRLHPDRNLNNPTVEQRFKDITQAYNLLSDQETRREYDRGRIDAHGRKRRPPFGQTAGHGWWPHGVETIFERVIDKFGLNGTGKTSSDQKSPAGKKPPRAAHDRHHKSMRESGQHHRLEVDFLTAVHGGKQRITTADGKTLDIDIPRGTADNTLLRLKGQEHSKEHGEGWGDLLISIRVLDHPLFTRRGRDLCLDLPISLKEALLGAKVLTPTIGGAVRLTIPARANSGQILRLKGKGVVDRHGGRGDQLVRLMVTLPKQPSAAMAADLERLAGHGDYDVRDHFGPP